MAYLITTTETYRVDSETEVAKIIEDAKNDNKYELTKYSSTVKETKQKGEVIDSWYRLTLTKQFCSEKEPSGKTQVYYGIAGVEEF